MKKIILSGLLTGTLIGIIVFLSVFPVIQNRQIKHLEIRNEKQMNQIDSLQRSLMNAEFEIKKLKN